MPTGATTLLHDGCYLAYEVRGSGPPAVFIQGTGLAGSGWRPQIDELARDFTCLSFDNRGMGASQPRAGEITVPRLATDTLALMDALGWPSAHLIGHSLGGLIAQEVALTAPQRVRSLALLCTFARGADATALTWKMFWLGLRTWVGTRAMRRRAFTEMVLPPGLRADRDAWAARLAPIFGHDLADHPPVVMAQLGAMRRWDTTRRLHELASVPTLLIAAAHDCIARPAMMRALAAGLPHARYEEFADAAHGVTIQHAVAVNGLLREHFLQAEARLASCVAG